LIPQETANHHLHSLAFPLHEWWVSEGLLSSCQPQPSLVLDLQHLTLLWDLLASTSWEWCVLSEESEFHSIVRFPDFWGTRCNQTWCMNRLKPATCWRSLFKFCLCRCRPCCEIAATAGCNTNWCRNRLEAQVVRTPSPPYPVYLQLMQNLATEEAIAVEDGGSNESQSSRQEELTVLN
jgi:hypothetical protein